VYFKINASRALAAGASAAAALSVFSWAMLPLKFLLSSAFAFANSDICFLFSLKMSIENCNN
jgi:hypothetical protein